MAEEYSYPIDPEWSTEEVIDVVGFFEAVEKAYEDGVSSEVLKDRYRYFKLAVPSKAEEKTIFREFKKNSGLEAYTAVKELKDLEAKKMIKVK